MKCRGRLERNHLKSVWFSFVGRMVPPLPRERYGCLMLNASYLTKQLPTWILMLNKIEIWNRKHIMRGGLHSPGGRLIGIPPLNLFAACLLPASS